MNYPIIIASWAASLGASYYLVNQTKCITKAQKIVQARVYAQGITVAMFLSSVLLSVTDKPDVSHQMLADSQSKSWERDLK